MSYLLDTHTFLWLVFNPSNLSSSSQEVLKDRGNRVSVSVLTFWEISLKYSLGKLILKNCTPESLVEVAKKLDLDPLELTPRDAAAFHRLPKMIHKDPFDRMIIWQAICHDLTLISRDKQFQAYQKLGLKTLW